MSSYGDSDDDLPLARLNGNHGESGVPENFTQPATIPRLTLGVTSVAYLAVTAVNHRYEGNSLFLATR